MNGASLPDVAVGIQQLRRRIRVARGEEPGDLLLAGGRIVNVFTERVERANVVIADGWIAGVGPYEWSASTVLDLAGQTVLPGLVDAHMHLESTLLLPSELARIVAPHGTSTLILDPHEMGNVLGVRGIDLLIAASENLPVDFFFMAPSCVPATAWEHAGAAIGPAEVSELLARPRVLGLAEMMDFPALLAGNEAVLGKILAAGSLEAPIDGHAPGMTGRDLVAYAAAGIRSDHESTTVEEAREKARLGMLVQVREGSMAHNLDALLPSIVAGELGDWCLATDDVHAEDLKQHGHIDALLSRAIAAGVAPAAAVKHATLVPARHYGLRDRGAIAPGYRADLLVVDDVAQMRPRMVFKGGEAIARDGGVTSSIAATAPPFENSVHLGPLDESAFVLRPRSSDCPVIDVVPEQIITRSARCRVRLDDGCWTFDPGEDVAVVASIERHRGTGNVGLGLVRGLGLRKHGALGSSVAHDSHNLIVAGTNPRDMLACVRALEATGGGYVAVADGTVLTRMPLPVAGLLSTEPADEVCRQLQEVTAAAQGLGSELSAPFGTLSFLALPVIPELRITDQGLFDVMRGEFVAI